MTDLNLNYKELRHLLDAALAALDKVQYVEYHTDNPTELKVFTIGQFETDCEMAHVEQGRVLKVFNKKK